ncbi:MAG: selenite/tellurite reduction operon protein ExtJ [Thermodesulfobacteriota bacterium]
MSKKIVSLALAMAFVATTAVASFAADCTGTVTAVSGDAVTVKCDDGKEVKATGAAKVGDKVTVKADKIQAAAKAKKKIEGC